MTILEQDLKIIDDGIREAMSGDRLNNREDLIRLLRVLKNKTRTITDAKAVEVKFDDKVHRAVYNVKAGTWKEEGRTVVYGDG